MTVYARLIEGHIALAFDVDSSMRTDVYMHKTKFVHSDEPNIQCKDIDLHSDLGRLRYLHIIHYLYHNRCKPVTPLFLDAYNHHHDHPHRPTL
jgi:hypothetical protein